MPSATARRWSKRTQVLTVLGIVLAAAVLTVGMVGFARSIGLVTRIGVASEALNDVGQISPDVAVGGGTNVPPAPASATVPAAPTTPATATSTPPPPRGGAAASPEAAPIVAAGTGGGAGAGGDAGAAGSSAGGMAGAGGGGGAAGAAPTYWDGVMQTMLTMLGPNTTQMCGPNTCNVGQVCCNPSCGTCVAPGATCDQTACAGAARTPSAVRCGMGQCSDGQVCCNASCGICAAPGETCSTAACP